MDRWYEPPTGMTLQDRLRRPLVSHAPDGAITDSDLARQLVDDRSDALVRIAELEAALKDLRFTSAVLLQNAEGCAVNHYGEDYQLHGEPGWLRDCRASIERAAKLINH